MLFFAVSVLVVAQSSSEIPEGLMNNPVLLEIKNLTEVYLKIPSILGRYGLPSSQHMAIILSDRDPCSIPAAIPQRVLAALCDNGKRAERK